MNNIFQTLLYQREKQKDTVLATIVWDDGSAPRGAGSQMLVGAEGLLSGTIGGGGLGDLAIRYGYQRFMPEVMWTVVVVLIILVQGIQSFGDWIVRRISHK